MRAQVDQIQAFLNGEEALAGALDSELIWFLISAKVLNVDCD